jgi:hypothetical protein
MMTDTTSASTASQPGRDDLAPRIFRALYESFDLLTIGVIHVVTPKGTRSLSAIPSAKSLARSATTSTGTRRHRHRTSRPLTTSPLASYRDRRRRCNRRPSSCPLSSAPTA